MVVSSKVTAAYKQVPLLAYLSQRFTYKTETEWQTLIQDGRVTCNGQIGQPQTIVSQGDHIACHLPDNIPADVDLNYKIIYEDEWLLAVNKPANLRVHDKRRYAQANLIYHLRHQHQPPYPNLTLVNRLDKNTSGIVLAAKDKATARQLQEQFRERQVKKVYLAVVAGIPRPAAGVIDLPVGRLPSLPGVYRFGIDRQQGKPAVTHYETEQTFANQYALVKLRPQTGRTHQLRVHMQAVGHTIIGDELYNLTDEQFLDWVEDKRPLTPALALLKRQALHSWQTQFIHPHSNRACRLEAPLPADIQLLLSRLQRLQ